MKQNNLSKDAVDKVCGKKIYARDLRAHDIENWGEITHHALLLRSYSINHRFLGVDKEILLPYKPYKILTSEQFMLDDIDITVCYMASYGEPGHQNLFVQKNEYPQYLGQPVALLLFDNFERYFIATQALRGTEYSQIYETDVESTNVINATDINRILDDWISSGVPPTENFSLRSYCGDEQRGYEFKDYYPLEKKVIVERQIFKSYKSIHFRTFTPTVDPCFMEPESGIARIIQSEGKQTLQIYLGTQAPDLDKAKIEELFAKVNKDRMVSFADVRVPYLGGGFGGRNSSNIGLYISLCAFYTDRVPVRLEYNRFEQFLVGIKRHASVVDNWISFDEKGNLEGIVNHFVFDGGSMKTLSKAVTGLGALHAAGPYKFKNWSINSVSVGNTGAPSGAMRGFGIPQVCFNIEQLIDQIAFDRNIDPIDFRLSQLVRIGDRNLKGLVLQNHIQNDAVCDFAKNTQLWQQRNNLRTEKSFGDKLFGVGFAMTMEAYGTGADSFRIAISVDDEYNLNIDTEVVDMGQGALASLADIPLTKLGRKANTINHGQGPKLDCQFQLDDQNQFKSNWVLYNRISNTSASKTAFFHTHLLEEACDLLLYATVYPAVMDILSINLEQLISLDLDWKSGFLNINGDQLLDWHEIMDRARSMKLPVSLIVHGSFHNIWASAKFAIDSFSHRHFVDGVGVKTSLCEPKFTWIERIEHVYPSEDDRQYKQSVYASGGHIIGVEINRVTGEVYVTDVICILDAGDIVNENLVKGQVEGGFAMGLGYALSEIYPSGSEAGANPINFDSYKIMHTRDIPINGFNIALLDIPKDKSILISGDRQQPVLRRKGIAEITLTTVAPAIGNAIAHAIGYLGKPLWPTNLPIDCNQVRKLLSQYS